MSTYMFAPPADLSTNEQNYVYWENGFSDFEISRIVSIGESLPKFPGYVDGSTDENPALRASEVSWIGLNNDTTFIYDKLAYIARQLNGQFFNFDLFGFVEDFQYTVYRSGTKDHYTWHMDKGNLMSSPRKLSLVLQLSSPEEYEGGDLEFLLGTTPIVAERRKGLVYAFPSYVLHRVTPVTAGTRRSLVVWIAGPKFR